MWKHENYVDAIQLNSWAREIVFGRVSAACISLKIVTIAFSSCLPFHQNRYTFQHFTSGQLQAGELGAEAGAAVVVAAAGIVNASLNRKMHAKNLRHCQHRH